MNDRPTPETDAMWEKFTLRTEWLEHARKLERERDELRERANQNVDTVLGHLWNIAHHYKDRLTPGMLEEIQFAFEFLEPPSNLATWDNDYKH